jgi:thymidylate synthase
MITDHRYQVLLRTVSEYGDLVETRNHLTKSCCDLDPITFTKTPMVTLRKTAWKLALREMEWFMSGDMKCPDELMPWWKDQLGYGGMYRGGYSHQYRRSGYTGTFDQIQYLLNGLRNNPNSRRLVMTTWNPSDMAYITELNHNPLTPSCCHASLVQLFVREGRVHMAHYQRSADLLLGVPHNWIQYWALLLYFAHHSELKVGSLRWIFGDAHIYHEPSHLDAVNQLLRIPVQPEVDNSFNLRYNTVVQSTGVPEFKARDFVIDGVIPEPKVFTKPKLL